MTRKIFSIDFARIHKAKGHFNQKCQHISTNIYPKVKRQVGANDSNQQTKILLTCCATNIEEITEIYSHTCAFLTKNS